MSNLVGKVLLNRFRVDAFVASGGMGTVYRVWDTQRNVFLAMKVLHSDLSEDPTAFKRFQREAHALEQLAHPNIVPFYGLFQADDASFLVEQYVDGPTLKTILRQHPAPFEPMEALIYFKALCSALSYAHNLGFVHCDIKPGNVMVDRGGNVYLTDFGIARQTSSTTTTLGIVGTPSYMAPEQIMAQAVTPATDVYAMGALLFELLTKRRPFSSSTVTPDGSSSTQPGQAMYAHLTQPPEDPRQYNPSIPEGLAAVIMTAMSKDASQRYQSTMEMLDAACSAMGFSPKQVPTRAPVSQADMGTLRLTPAETGYPQPTPPVAAQPQAWAPPPAQVGTPVPGTVQAPEGNWAPGTVRASTPAYAPGTVRAPEPQPYPADAYPGYAPAEQPPARKSFPTAYLAGGALLAIVACGFLIGFIGIPIIRDMLATATPTAGAGSSVTKPTNTLIPTQGALPTYTMLPTYTIEIIPTEVIFPTEPPPPTEAPPPTQPSSLTNFKIKIRNKAGYEANLYRIGSMGERHFLGWVAPNYYGEYTWPSAGTWTIEYCRRQPSTNPLDHVDISCAQTSCNIFEANQECQVP